MRLTPAIPLILLTQMGVLISTASSEEKPAKSAELTKENVAFFETYIRPVLAERCYECHSAKAKKLKGKLLLDSQAGIAKGGDNGLVIVPQDVEKSRLIQALRWTDPDLAMPPKEKLTALQIEKFEQWVKMGAPDPRTETAATTTKAIDLNAGRKWWSFQPVAELTAPSFKQKDWPKKKIDSFVLHKLEEKQLAPSPRADPRTLIQRAYLDLTGLRPPTSKPKPSRKIPQTRLTNNSSRNCSPHRSTASAGADIGSTSSAMAKTTQPPKPPTRPTPMHGATAIGSLTPSIAMCLTTSS